MNSLTSLNLGSSFTTGKVTDMSYMFSDNRALTTLDLRSFNTSGVTNMSYMFYGTKALKEIKATTGSWVIGTSTNVTNMFLSSKISSVTLY